MNKGVIFFVFTILEKRFLAIFGIKCYKSIDNIKSISIGTKIHDDYSAALLLEFLVVSTRIFKKRLNRHLRSKYCEPV